MKKKEQKELPHWIDEEVVKAKRQMGHNVAHWLNSTLVPICRECEVELTEENHRELLQDFNLVGEIYISRAVESIDNAYLADAVRDSAEKKFAEITERYSSPIPKAVKYGLGYGGERSKITTENIVQYLRLRDGVFDVDEDAILAEHMHFVESEAYERVEKMCEAINDVFKGKFDTQLLLGMLYYKDGFVTPFVRFNWKLLS